MNHYLKEPLKGRINIVLSKNECFENKKVTVCRSIGELFQELIRYNSEDVFLIGGESLYRQLISYCSEAYVTKIENIYTADKHFINLDKDNAWKLVSTSNLQTYKDIKYKFVKYSNDKLSDKFECGYLNNRLDT